MKNYTVKDVIKYFFTPEDSATPILIRKSILPTEGIVPYQRRVTHTDPPPGFWAMSQGSSAMAANWSSFVKPSSIPGCTEELQVPIFIPTNLVRMTLTVLTIFRAGPKGLAVLVTGVPEKLQDIDKSVPFLKQDAKQML